MLKCPNKNLPSWKKLHSLTPSISNYVWDKLDGNISNDGKPIDNLNRFNQLLEESNNDYKQAYLKFLGVSEKEVSEYIPIKEDIIGDDTETSFRQILSEKDKELLADLTQLDELAAVKRKSINNLENKLNLLIQKKIIKSETEIEGREDFIKRLHDLEAEEAMILFTKQAAENVNKIWREWLNVKVELDKISAGTSDKRIEEVLSAEMLYRWRDFLSAYDTIEDFEAAILDDGRIDNIKVEFVKGRPVTLKSVLSDTISKKNKIKKLYDVKGLDLLSVDLEPYYGKIHRDAENTLKMNYRSLSKAEKSKISEEDYVRSQQDILDKDEQSRRQRTRILIRNELLKANKDINLATRWFGLILDSSDPIIAAVGKRMALAEIETNSKKLKFRDEMISLMEELSKVSKDKKTMKELFDFMLEKDEKGNYTGHTISKFDSKFWNNYEQVLQDAKNNETLGARERKDIIRGWIRNHTISHDEEFNRDKWSYIDSLKKQGIVTEQEYKDLEWNDLGERKNPYELYDSDILSKESSDLIGSWIADNIWDYRDPLQENKQWTKLQNILKNSNDPRTKFYEFIKRTEDEANSYLSVNMRLKHGKLPAVVKTGRERFEEGESPARLVGETIRRWFDVLPDDTSRGGEPLVDEQGNLRYFVPMYFTGELTKYQIIDKNGNLIKEFAKKSEAESYVDKHKEEGYSVEKRRALEDQSYDLPTIYFRFYAAAVDYHSKNSILPEMEMAKYFINNREVTRTDPKGNPIKKLFRVSKREETESKPGKGGRLAEQFNDWFDMVFYGVKENREGTFKIFGMNFDVAKTLNAITRFTSLNILALNFRAGIANTILGEALQAAEAYARQHMSIKSYHKANLYYTKHFLGILGDVGKIKKNSIINLLYEGFGIPPETLNTDLKDNTRLKNLANFSSLYFFMTSGDTYMQTRLFLGMLAEKKAYDKSGNLLGSMLDQYSKDSKGNLKLSDKVNLEKSKWTDRDRNDFSVKVKGVISGVHGEYSDLGRIAIQRMSIGRMAIMFRKFVVPGITRRYKKNSYVERMGDYTEGYYRTAGRYISNLAREFRTYQFHVFGKEWNKLSDVEKSNIRRVSAELGFLVLAYILSWAFLKLGEDDDEWVWDFMSYQMLRFRTEMWFYLNPAEAQKILRSPAATMSVFENTMKLFTQIFEPGERYQRGPWKDHLKLEKIMWDFVPAARSFYQTRDIKQQINFMR